MAPKFVTKQTLDLVRSADTTDWQAPESILKVVPNLADLKLVILDSSYARSWHKLTAFKECFTVETNVGLVVLGKHIGRFHKPGLIAIVTSTTIFAIDLMDESHVMFIDLLNDRIKDENSSITFWTTQGLQEADSLLNNYNISLNNANRCYDCQSMHASILQYVNKQTTMIRNCYPEPIPIKAKSKIMLEDWKSLIEIWLNIPQNDIAYNLCQLDHLHKRPLSLTAFNVIKKRCCLVMPLAGKLAQYVWFEPKRLSASLHRKLSLIESKPLYDLMHGLYVQRLQKEYPFAKPSTVHSNVTSVIEMDIFSHYWLSDFNPDSR